MHVPKAWKTVQTCPFISPSEFGGTGRGGGDRGGAGSSHAVSEPDASSPASFVFSAGHATHDFDDTYSFAAQSLAEHVADVKVPSEHDDTPEAKYPASHVGVHKSPERIVSGHVPKAPFDGGATLHDSARVNSSSLFSVV